MFQISAPYPAPVAITVLPNPGLGDSVEPTETISIRRSIDGTRRTYVKRKSRDKRVWSFLLTRAKGIELREFFLAHAKDKVRVDWTYSDCEGPVTDSWAGYFTINPVEFETARRGAGVRHTENLSSRDLGETVAVQIEFEGEDLVSLI